MARKIKILKIPAKSFCTTLKWTSMQSFMVRRPVGPDIFVDLGENWV